MTSRTDAAIQADRRRVQRAAVRTGLWVGVASAAVVALLTTATVLAMVATSRLEHHPAAFEDREGEGPGVRVVDLDDAIPVAVALGLLGVIALGMMAWYLARRAAQPLAEALAVQRTFVADASHELRTPLTTLTSRIQLAQHRAERGGDVDGVLRDMRRDASVMDGVLTDLLLSAESAGAAVSDADSVAPVSWIAGEAAALLEPRAAQRGVTIAVEASPTLQAAADRVAVLRALTALLDNAVRFAPSGSTVRVSALEAARRVDIRVSDDGPGITGIDPERIFERFARADIPGGGSRGFGLGLALVRDIATRFDGSVTVEETSAHGTTFLLSFPTRR